MRIFLELKKGQAVETVERLEVMGFVPDEPVDLRKTPLEGDPDLIVSAGDLPTERLDDLHLIDGIVSWQPAEM